MFRLREVNRNISTAARLRSLPRTQPRSYRIQCELRQAGADPAQARDQPAQGQHSNQEPPRWLGYCLHG